ncbi:MAG: glycoside hydrolase family 3 C-terminal domain-containing protein [Victivallaceae bacterium]|nr:glycoside hydrolase family 3 C-terminal domain-containing protein [Victivallaceae bacterium]
MEKELLSLLEKLTLDEKISLCHGATCTEVAGIPRLGIKSLVMNDGPQGVRMEDGRTATAMPCGMALAATFSPALAAEYGAAVARECNSNHINVILGPGLNLMRTPMNGRNFEYFGEDPLLAGKIAAGYISGCQKEKVAAVPKHLALNNQEICRTTGNSICDRQTMRNLYLRSFEILTRGARPWMMMSSYNKINGEDASACEYTQKNVIKGMAGFDGVMVSDWGGLHDTVKAALHGTDLEMGSGHFADTLKAKVESGEVPMPVLDGMVLRMLRLLWRTGRIEHDGFIPGEAEANTPRNRAVARKIAAAGTVLLKNDAGMLPLAKARLKRILVTGPEADYHHCLGGLENCGGSGAVHPDYEITPLAGVREYLKDTDIEIVHSPGVRFEDSELLPDALLRHPDGGNGVRVSFFDGDFDRAPFDIRHAESLNCRWGVFLAAGRSNDDPLNLRAFKVRMETQAVPAQSGRIFLTYNTSRLSGRVLLDGREVLRNGPGTTYPVERGIYVDAEAGKPLNLTVEMSRSEAEFTEFRMLWCVPAAESIRQTAELAKTVDCVLFFGGRTHRDDREAIGWGDVPAADVTSWRLPANQNELISALCAANPNVVGCFVSGGPFDVSPWIDRIPAMLEGFYGGMESGRAWAGLLFGSVEPQGRLPFTWAAGYDDYSCHANGCYPGVRGDNSPHTEYREREFIGYRHADATGKKPVFPFGFGLGYSPEPQFEIVSVKSDGNGDASTVKVVCRAENPSDKAAFGVAQLYAAMPDNAGRPPKELVGFAAIALPAAGSQLFDFVLDRHDLARCRHDDDHPAVAAGEYRFTLNCNAAEIADSQLITLA